MYFKKSGKTIFGVQLNKAEQKAMDQEIRRQIVENDRRLGTHQPKHSDNSAHRRLPPKENPQLDSRG